MTNNFDLVVIGTGAAGASAANGCRSAGWSVAIVDSRPFGGTCALRGCDPKKVLVGATEVIERARQMAGKGIASEDIRIDWPALIRFKRTFTDPVPADREQQFLQAGITVFRGRARFTDKTTIQVGDEELVGRFVVIAAGARPPNQALDRVAKNAGRWQADEISMRSRPLSWWRRLSVSSTCQLEWVAASFLRANCSTRGTF